MGFEFEAGGVLSGELRGKKLEYLAKKAKLLTGAGFVIEADEVGGVSDVEFVVDPVEETQAGETRLREVIGRMVKLTEAADKLINNEDKYIPMQALRDYGTPEANRYINPYRLWRAQVQATAGIRLESLNTVLGHLAQPNQSGALSGQQSENLEEQKESEITPLLEPIHQQPSGLAMSNLFSGDDELAAVHAAAQAQVAQIFHDANPAVAGLVGMLANYLVRGAKGVPEYGKTISGSLMARTDFAYIFAMLPAQSRAYFQANPERFVNLVIAVAHQADNTHTYNKGDAVFSGGLYNIKPEKQQSAPIMTGLKIGAWLRNLVPPLSDQPSWLKRLVGSPLGTDLLTAKSFPGSAEARAEVESLGGYGYKKDILNQQPITLMDRLFGQRKPPVPAPIFEFRALRTADPQNWVEYAVSMLKYVRLVNQRR